MLHPRGHCSNILHCLLYMGECLFDTVRDCDISHTIAKCVPASSTHAFIAYTSTRLLIQVATSCYSPSSSENTKSITLFSLCMHITRQLCQAGHACTCPLATRESEQAAPQNGCFGPWELANASSHSSRQRVCNYSK